MTTNTAAIKYTRMWSIPSYVLLVNYSYGYMYMYFMYVQVHVAAQLRNLPLAILKNHVISSIHHVKHIFHLHGLHNVLLLTYNTYM